MRLLGVFLAVIVAVSGLMAQDRQLLKLGDDAGNLLAPDGWRSLGGTPAQLNEGVLTCDNGSESRARGGFVQTVQLNQDRPRAIIAQAFARSSGVGGSADHDYSLYLDIIYTDGTPLWGQFEPFRTGSADWHSVTVRVLPAKPIRSVSVYLLLRNHSGKAQFRDAVLSEAKAPAGACWFDGQLVSATASTGQALYIRDVAAGGGFVRVRNDGALGVKAKIVDRGRGLADLQLSDDSGKDRALTVVYTQSVKADRWLAGLSAAKAIEAQQEYVDGVRVRAGGGMLSRYPFAAVANAIDGKGAALGLDMSTPAIFRAGYAAGTGELYLAADIALAREKPSCRIGIVSFAFEGGFREALSAYTRTRPDASAVRVKRQGLWMPFFQVSKVQGWEDFGFAFKEGNDETAWDDAHEILTFRYTEPMTWWMALPKGTPRTLEAAMSQANSLASQGNIDAKAWQSCAIFDSAGRAAGQIKNEPWCDGIVWSMNSAPGIGAPGGINHFATKWSRSVQDSLYGARAKGSLDGEYIDSVEGYVTDDLDYRREHFASMRTALTFSPVDRRPAIYKGLIAFEYVRQIAGDCHARGKLAMANGTPARWPWIPPMLDVMGTETDWNPGGKWNPMSIDEMRYRRAMAGKKPFCFLMNTNFDQFPPELVERYMKRAAALGMFPGFFSHNASEKQYFSQPVLYNRDRPLFKKYVPIIRKLAEAGWEPITRASSPDQTIVIERFGEKLWTVYNPDAQTHEFVLHFADPPTSPLRDLLTGRQLPAGQPTLTLASEDLAVLEVP